jgi:hypothetical protein
MGSTHQEVALKIGGRRDELVDRLLAEALRTLVSDSITVPASSSTLVTSASASRKINVSKSSSNSSRTNESDNSSDSDSDSDFEFMPPTVNDLSNTSVASSKTLPLRDIDAEKSLRYVRAMELCIQFVAFDKIHILEPFSGLQNFFRDSGGL